MDNTVSAIAARIAAASGRLAEGDMTAVGDIVALCAYVVVTDPDPDVSNYVGETPYVRGPIRRTTRDFIKASSTVRVFPASIEAVVNSTY